MIALRDCFLSPIPEMDQAIDLFDQAADAIQRRDFAQAEHLARLADIPAIFEFAQLVMGPTVAAIHGTPPKRFPKQDVSGARMPSARAQIEVFSRDGWRCRFCGIRVIAKSARPAFERSLPGVIHWPASNAGRHSAFFALEVSLDHILPFSRGGNNEPSNLVAACQSCQFGRNQWTLEEVGLSDPRLRPPIVDRWDGLTRL